MNLNNLRIVEAWPRVALEWAQNFRSFDKRLDAFTKHIGSPLTIALRLRANLSVPDKLVD